MSAQFRFRRLARIQALEEVTHRARAREFATALARSAEAAAQLSHVEGLILTAAPLPAARSVAALNAAAHLRALLLPAAEMASARLQSAVALRAEAEKALLQQRLRSQRLAETLATARHMAGQDARMRDGDACPAPPRKTPRKTRP